MDATPHASPFYLKLSLTLLAVVLLGLLVFLGKDILLPLLFSVLLSTLLLPFTTFSTWSVSLSNSIELESRFFIRISIGTLAGA